MEALANRDGRTLWLILGLVLLLRLPFLNQAVQGDDDFYISEAAHAQIEPLHPNNFHYVFRGEEVDARGQSHPPANAWPLGALIAIFGDVKEVPFHAAYIVFSLIAAAAMWSLARRFSPHPLWATLLFLAVPAFVVNGNSFETDVPFLAFWLAGVALFVSGRLWIAVAAMGIAALYAYQAVFLTPILAVYVWLYRRGDRAAWLAIVAAPLTLGAWQLFERFSTGAAGAGVLAGYFSHYGFQDVQNKLRNAAALSVHLCFIVFPLLLPSAAVLAWRKRRSRDTQFLLAWIAIFFAGALIIFFAGSARYLLPIAAPVALLVSRLRPRWLAAGFAAQLALGLGLAIVNYQHWGGYRDFAHALQPRTEGHRVWVDDGLGLRYYMDAQGALPLIKTQQLRPGEIVVSSQLTRAVNVTAPVTPIAQKEITAALPFRIIGIDSHSAFSSASEGFWPFGFSNGPIDRVNVVEVGERHVTLEYLALPSAEAAQHIVSGIFPDRWMGHSGVVVLKSPGAPRKLSASFFIPPDAPARRISLLLDGHEVASKECPGPGPYTLQSPPVKSAAAIATVEIQADRTFFAPHDSRELGIVLTAVGFVP